MRPRDSAVRIGLVYPDLLGTYGDRGNATVLAQRLARRGIAYDVVTVHAGEPVPRGLDIYLLGGGEDDQQTTALEGLRAVRDELDKARVGDSALVAICAGFQLIGRRYLRSDGVDVAGLGLVDATTVPGPVRLIGDLVVEPRDPAIPTLSGFENHRGVTTLGDHEVALGTVTWRAATVDAAQPPPAAEGVLRDHVLATYLHGPLFARNPALADHVLSWVAGKLEPLATPLAEQLRAERLAAARALQSRRQTRFGRLRERVRSLSQYHT